jgi:type II secretory pathway pseudopilin PulG
MMKRILVMGMGLLWVVAAGGCGDDDSGDNNNTATEICANTMDDDGDGLVDCNDPDCLNNPACQSETETLCDDGLDNDADGMADCLDADCQSDPACQSQTETVCDDGLDDDGDGDIDCADADCAGETYCEATETTCDDVFDNDGDGDVDCADSDCSGDAACAEETICDDGLDNDSDGDIDCADSDCASETYCESPEATCDDSFDNDGDGDVDCADSDCSGDAACQTESVCDDGTDNDSDGDIDCADSDCASETYCESPEATCDDSFDNDGDGDVDCADSDCSGDAACQGQTETVCDDGLDDDSDGDIDCADSDCASEAYCETTESTCNDAFDNDGDGDVDCADSDCSSDPNCASTGTTGDACTSDADCTVAGAFCLLEQGAGFPSGYCTVDCSSSGTCTEADTECINAGLILCAQHCTLANPTECRPGYSCEDISLGTGMGVCWPSCQSNAECGVTNQCDSTSGFCVWGDVVAGSETVTNDPNSDGIADAGETFELAFDAYNQGGGLAAGPIDVAVIVNSTASTVTGTVALTAPSNTTCAAGDLAADTSVSCQPWTVQVPGTAQSGERVAFDFTFTGPNDTWTDTWALSVGTSYQTLIPSLDPQGDQGTFDCDLRDVVGYEASGTLYLRMDFHASCTPAGIMDLYLCDATNCVTLTLEDDGSGNMVPTIWSNAGGWYEVTTLPGSYQVTPSTFPTQNLDYEIAIADIPDLDTSAQRLDVRGSIGATVAYDDNAPDTGFGSIAW